MNYLERNHSEFIIIYIRSRRGCEQIHSLINSNGIKCNYYHGGLDQKIKNLQSSQWINGERNIMVATNAFGMGIDKPNVRHIIHLDLPDNLENYYQEIGRAGRDGNPSKAILMIEKQDFETFKKRSNTNLPDKKSLSFIYRKLNSYLQIPLNQKPLEIEYLFDFEAFCTQYKLNPNKTANCINFLELNGILSITQSFNENPKVRFKINNDLLLKHLKHCSEDQKNIIDVLIRTYSGISIQDTSVKLHLIKNKTKLTISAIKGALEKLQKENIISLKDNSSNKHSIQFHVTREDEKTINRLSKNLSIYLKSKQHSFKKAFDFYKNTETCLFKTLLEYFGERTEKKCLNCSNCLGQPLLEEEIKLLLKHPNTINTLCGQLEYSSEEIIKIVENLIRQGIIHITSEQKLIIRHEN